MFTTKTIVCPTKNLQPTVLRLGTVGCIAALLTACASQPISTVSKRPVYVRGVPNYYIVKNGDTLSKIATMYGLDYRRVGALNGLDGNYTIYPGQRLILTTANNPTSYRPTTIRTVTVNQPQRPTNTAYYPPRQMNTPTSSLPMPSQVIVPTSSLSQGWLRPTSGNLLRAFNQQTGALGMWFGAQTGAAVVASQPGTVLYVGSDLPEYGKLILIQHNSDYISAYAHLGSFAVQERQTVQAGQTIGTVGTDNVFNQPAMEFQIRYRGTPINPASYLK